MKLGIRSAFLRSRGLSRHFLQEIYGQPIYLLYMSMYEAKRGFVLGKIIGF